MSIREILKDGEPALSKVCHPVTQFDQKLWDLLDDLKGDAGPGQRGGAGGPQVGILRRAVIVMDENFEPMELVNPEILAQEGGAERPGGLSVRPRPVGLCQAPGVGEGAGLRPERECLRGGGTGLTARCFCHELAHLDGHLYTELTDRLYDSDELDELMEENEK